MDTYYAIEVIGYGARRRYVLKRIESSGPFGPVTTSPVDHIAYRSEADARRAARLLGLVITKIGDHYHII